jgi:gliding motility-associated lipoprotein GldH
MKNNIFIYPIILIFFFSCKGEKTHHYSFLGSKWNSQQIVKFDITTKDSTQVRISNISIRHNTSYKYQNIIFFLHHSYKENIISTNTIELLLAEDNGKWIGKGKSNIKEFSTTILSPKIYQNGLHSFSLELAMRDNTSTELEKLDGISDISFYLTTENED